MSSYTAQNFMTATDVSRETLALFEKWENLLTHWNKSINLVQKATVSEFWSRHALDSAQLFASLPDRARECLDLGSGAGFPGLALAIMGRGRVGFHVDLIEANGKKSSFLRTVIRELGLPARAISERAESLPAKPYDVISARAFAPLPKLLDYAAPFWAEHTVGIFPKGRAYQDELVAARESYDYDVQIKASESDEAGKVLIISNLRALTEVKTAQNQQKDKDFPCA